MDELLEHVQTTLTKLGLVTARKMFGGLGLYCDGTFFALIADDVLYLKVDDTNRADYDELGYEAFQPFPDKPGRMNYYEIPSQVLQDPRAAVRWACKSVDIALKNPKRKKKASKKKAGKPKSKKLSQLRNIGPKSARMLGAVGLETREDLERLGSIGASLAVREAGESALCVGGRFAR